MVGDRRRKGKRQLPRQETTATTFSVHVDWTRQVVVKEKSRTLTLTKFRSTFFQSLPQHQERKVTTEGAKHDDGHWLQKSNLASWRKVVCTWLAV